MLKKMIIVSSAAAIAAFCGAGVAYAEGPDGGNTKCTSNDTTHQKNKGDQLIGGNLTAQDVESDALGVQTTRPAGICPSVLNNNHF